MDEARHFQEWEGYVDWKNRPALRGQHGGMLAASFVLGPLNPYIASSNIPTQATKLHVNEQKHNMSGSRRSKINNAVFRPVSGGTSGSTTYRNRVPRGSPITEILKVLTAALYNTCICKTLCNTTVSGSITTDMHSQGEEDIHHADQLEAAQLPTETEFLNRAVHDRPDFQALECTVKEVEDVRIVLKILPIFMSTIMLNCCLAQLSTFSVQQAATMNNKIGSLRVPPASLPVFPVLFIMVLAPMYNHVIIPFARKVTRTETGITHLQRIGTGLFLSIVAMTVAALAEMKRKKVATQYGQLNSTKPLPITFLWVSLQYLFLGSADLFTLAGMMEFFFTEAPLSLRSLATSLSWASLAMGYYLSSVLVTTVNRITSTFGHTPWLYGSNINYYHLERFYWLMGILSGLNFLHFLFWANRYKYRSTRSEDE
ncbi:hypothetical protein AgCh_015959 [Apium graveolens]